MSDPRPETALVEVRLLELSLSAYRESSQHHDGLRREFALIAQRSDDLSVPTRLLALIDQLNERFETFASAPRRQLDAALAGDRDAIDLLYLVPSSVGPAAAELDALLDEADAYCLAGDALLTLAAPARVAAFRRWFLGEFVRQTRGEHPTPWREPEPARD